MHFIQAEELEGVKIEMEEGLKLEEMYVSHIKIDLTHSWFLFFGNWQFWMASTVDDKHEPKSQKVALVFFNQLRWTFRLWIPVDPVGLLFANEPKEHIRLVVQVES